MRRNGGGFGGVGRGLGGGFVGGGGGFGGGGGGFGGFFDPNAANRAEQAIDQERNRRNWDAEVTTGAGEYQQLAAAGGNASRLSEWATAVNANVGPCKVLEAYILAVPNGGAKAQYDINQATQAAANAVLDGGNVANARQHGGVAVDVPFGRECELEQFIKHIPGANNKSWATLVTAGARAEVRDPIGKKGEVRKSSANSLASDTLNELSRLIATSATVEDWAAFVPDAAHRFGRRRDFNMPMLSPGGFHTTLIWTYFNDEWTFDMQGYRGILTAAQQAALIGWGVEKLLTLGALAGISLVGGMATRGTNVSSWDLATADARQFPIQTFALLRRNMSKVEISMEDFRNMCLLGFLCALGAKQTFHVSAPNPGMPIATNAAGTAVTGWLSLHKWNVRNQDWQVQKIAWSPEHMAGSMVKRLNGRSVSIFKTLNLALGFVIDNYRFIASADIIG